MQAQSNIMIVDDNPVNLKLLEAMLRAHDYNVRSFPGGRLALAAADCEPPDLILLDINMPEMNGYEVCAQLKSSALLSDIPVIFLSALNSLEDKVKGFRAGGVDYMSKPFQFEEVHARVETHLKLRGAQKAEHDLLEKTLSGAVGTLWELVQLTSPALALRSRAIREIVVCVAKGRPVTDRWHYELAATLCLVGCIALPDEVFERAYRGLALSPAEAQMFRVHPERGARLLSSIPRLEVVAEIIRRQQDHGEELRALPSSESLAAKQVREGAHMLCLALEFDRIMDPGVDPRAVVIQLGLSGRFDPAMLGALDSYSPAQTELEEQCVPVGKVRAGMVLEEDVWTKDGKLLILKKGTVLKPIWIERLENFSTMRGVKELMRVRSPRLAASPEQLSQPYDSICR